MRGESRLTAFVATTDPDRARDFYEGKLGLNFPNGDQVAWFKDPDGNTLSLARMAPRAEA